MRPPDRINRRQLLRLAGIASAAAFTPIASRPATAQTTTRPRFQAFGDGPPLMLGISEEGRQDLVNRLADRYRVIVPDYPPQGEAARALESRFTPEYVIEDLLSIADQAGADRFAWYGYSWGGVVGLQLATRTNRLNALICGGWPPLGAPYVDMPRAAAANAERAGQPKIWATFYRGLEQWPEREAVSKITIPRMAFAGSDDVIDTDEVTARIGPLIAEHRGELEAMGWEVVLVDGFDHELGRRPDLVAPLIRTFLDRELAAQNKTG